MTVEQLKNVLTQFNDEMEVKIKYYQDNENPHFSSIKEDVEIINLNIKNNAIELTYEA